MLRRYPLNSVENVWPLRWPRIRYYSGSSETVAAPLLEKASLSQMSGTAGEASAKLELPLEPELVLPREGDLLEGKYEIEHILGEGGMCVVYGAMHLQLEERVAVKLLRPEMIDQPDLVARFLQEGRAAIRIRSEHVVRIFDVGTLASGHPYLVMEYLQGSDLDALLLANGNLPIQAAVDYVLQAGEAIAEAHTLGIVHRDLKPANLFLTRRADGSPWVKVLDFGISKVPPSSSSRGPDLGLTLAATVMGSPRYMSPEQMRSTKNVDARTDIWSLGTILYELLAGEPPFKGDTMPEICASILQDPLPAISTIRPEIPVALEAAIARCLQKDPADRFAHMGDVAHALAEFASPSGRTSAQRIVGILQTSNTPVHGGILVNPTSEGTAWGSTAPSHEPTPPKKRSAANVFWIGCGALMLVAGGVLAAPFVTREIHQRAHPSPVTTTAATSLALDRPTVETATTTSRANLAVEGRTAPPATAQATRDAGASTSTSATAATATGNPRPTVTAAAVRRREAPPARQAPVTAPAHQAPVVTAPVVSAPAPAPAAQTNPDGTDILFDDRK
jgi:eukaryotic-like serine/threonine-protein kinase